MKRRLLFISNLFPDEGEPYRGLDNAVLLGFLRPHLADIRALGIRPTLDPRQWGLRPANSPWKARADDAALHPRYLGVPYVPKLGSQLNDRLMAVFLERALAELQATQPFDLILCSWLFPDGAALARLRGGAARPFLLICQGSDAHQYLKIPARKQAILAAIGKSGGVITRSADLARILGEAGAPVEKLHPIYNGVFQDIFHPLPPEERQAQRAGLGLGQDDIVNLFVGNFLPVKNPRLLLDAFAAAKQRLAAAGSRLKPRLLLVGGGPLESEMMGWSSELGLRKDVRFEGRMNAQGVGQRMQAADVFCMSSVNEGVPNVVLEAQATGVPVVVTNVGGIGEIIRTAEQGTLTPPGEVASLATALLDHWQAHEQDTLAEARRYKISRIGKDFAWDTTALQYYEQLQKL